MAHVLFAIYLLSLGFAMAVLGMLRGSVRRQWLASRPASDEYGGEAALDEAALAVVPLAGPTAADLARAELAMHPVAMHPRRRAATGLRRTA